jgi:hypothetical protein
MCVQVRDGGLLLVEAGQLEDVVDLVLLLLDRVGHLEDLGDRVDDGCLEVLILLQGLQELSAPGKRWGV